MKHLTYKYVGIKYKIYIMDEKLVEIKKKADEIKDLYNNYLKFKAQKFSYTQIESDKGILAIEDGTELAVSSPIFLIDEAGNSTTPEDGTYVLTDGRTLEIAAGLVVEIAESTEEGEESPEETAAPSVEGMAEETPASPASPDNVDKVDESGMEERLMTLEQNMEKIMEMLQGLMSKQEEELTQVNNKMSRLFTSINEEVKREDFKNESLNSKISNNGDIMNDLKTYNTTRNLKLGKKVETFGEMNNPEVADRIKDMRDAMANARVSGNGGSLTITN